MGLASLVSVIIPTYNRAETVCQSVESVLQQTYSKTEIIVVDDGSTDDTRTKLDHYAGRIRIITQENAGPSIARNRGIQASRGEILAFLDSDDIWLSEKLERQVSLLERAGKSVPCCISNAILQVGKRPGRTSFENALLFPCEEEGLWLNVARILLHRFVLFNQAVAIRREAFEKVGGFDETLRYLEDYDLALRLSLLGPFAFISEPLVTYNQGTPGSLAMEALEKVVRVRENQVRILERMDTIVGAHAEHAELSGPARWSLRRARRQLWTARLGQKKIPKAEAVSRLLDRAEHYWGAAFDRTPLFQRMKTAPIPNEPAFSVRPSCTPAFQDMA